MDYTDKYREKIVILIIVSVINCKRFRTSHEFLQEVFFCFYDLFLLSMSVLPKDTLKQHANTNMTVAFLSLQCHTSITKQNFYSDSWIEKYEILYLEILVLFYGYYQERSNFDDLFVLSFVSWLSTNVHTDNNIAQSVKVKHMSNKINTNMITTEKNSNILYELKHFLISLNSAEYVYKQKTNNGCYINETF
jgi:hypothetical protein